jgi:broad specificity phosphatase PhoE
MPATLIHLVRHGEVNNPDGVLYGRLPNFSLSELGHEMASKTAQHLKDSGVSVARLVGSPLQRTLESAKPIAEKFNVPIETEEQIIEPSNIFEGKQVSLATVLKNPKLLTKLFNPLKPSWGEPFEEIKDRMVWAMRSVWDQTATGEVVMVSHQLPIWMVHRFSQGERLAHDPRSRRCELSSVTSFVFEGAKLLEVDYQDPAHELRKLAIDSGAV